MEKEKSLSFYITFARKNGLRPLEILMETLKDEELSKAKEAHTYWWNTLNRNRVKHTGKYR